MMKDKQGSHSIIKQCNFCIGALRRLARRRERDRTRRAAMISEERDAARQLRRHRRAATTSAMMQREQHPAQGSLPEQQAMDHSSQATPSTNHSFNDSLPQFDRLDVIERIQGFHTMLSDLQNTLCNICKERFPTIRTNELGVCHRCLADSQVPKLFSVENNMDPGSVPAELCVSCIFVLIVNNHRENVSTSLDKCQCCMFVTLSYRHLYSSNP